MKQTLRRETADIRSLKLSPDIEYFFDDITGKKWDEFMDSIRRHGVLNPLLVTSDGKQILSGRQRYKACLKLGIKRVPVERLDIDPSDRDAQRIVIIESNIRQRGIVNSPTLKLGRILMEMERHGGADGRDCGRPKPGESSRREIRARLGVDAKVANCAKKIAAMEPDLQSLIADGIVAPRVAYDVLGGLTPADQRVAAAAIRLKYDGHSKVTGAQVKELIGKQPQGEKGRGLQMLQTDSIFSITRDIFGQSVVISLTDAEAEQVVRLWMERSLNQTDVPVDVTEEETKQTWRPVKAYSTGVLSQHMDEVIDMYQKGLSPARIGETFGVSATTVRRHLQETEIPMRNTREALLAWRKNRHVA